MKKIGVIIVIVLALTGGAFGIWSAVVAKKKSDDIVSKLKEVNEDLASYNDSIDVERTGASLAVNYPAIDLYNQIVLLIDSLKAQYAPMSDEPHRVKPPQSMERDIKRLAKYIQQVNKVEWDMVDSKIPDTISYWENPAAFNADKWYADFFRDQYKVQSITYLDYLKNQAVARMHVR